MGHSTEDVLAHEIRLGLEGLSQLCCQTLLYDVRGRERRGVKRRKEDEERKREKEYLSGFVYKGAQADKQEGLLVDGLADEVHVVVGEDNNQRLNCWS